MTRFDRVFVWTGGALFVLALLATAYMYFIRWGTAAAIHDPSALPIDIGVLTVFAVHHSLFARDGIKRWLARMVPDRLMRSVYVWVASVLLIVTLVAWRPVAGEFYNADGWRAVLHAFLQAIGVWLIARSVARIDPLELAGIKPISGQEALQIAGPYRWVRHPLYLGWVLALFGTAHMTADRLTFAAITTAYLLLAIPLEERSLERTFGDAYRQYERQVRWRIVPYVY
jgi:protein-S-isoprenylcysteine O-methyltransferase Ste14